MTGFANRLARACGMVVALTTAAMLDVSVHAQEGTVPVQASDPLYFPKIRRLIALHTARADAYADGDGGARARSILEQAEVPVVGPLSVALADVVPAPLDEADPLRHPVYQHFLNATLADILRAEADEEALTDARVAYGIEVDEDSLREVVLLKRTDGTNRCSGTLMTRDTVITAAHCLCGTGAVGSVVFGANDASSRSIAVTGSVTPGGVTLTADACLQQTVARDIAVLKLAAHAADEDWYQRIYLPSAAKVDMLLETFVGYHLQPRGQIIVAGFGYDENDVQGIKRQAAIPVLNHDCTPSQLTLAGIEPVCAEGNEFIATNLHSGVPAPAESPCRIDSGGPAYALDGNHRYQVGIVSRSQTLGSRNCDEMAIYTRFSETRLAFIRQACRELGGTGCP